jgi:hypothetical protein
MRAEPRKTSAYTIVEQSPHDAPHQARKHPRQDERDQDNEQDPQPRPRFGAYGRDHRPPVSYDRRATAADSVRSSARSISPSATAVESRSTRRGEPFETFALCTIPASERARPPDPVEVRTFGTGHGIGVGA